MLNSVEKHIGVPAYIQIMNVIKKEILLGRLKSDDQLPPVRELAKIFKVNMNTVIRALEKLQGEEVIRAEHGVGYFITITQNIDFSIIGELKKSIEKAKKDGLSLGMMKLLIEEVWKNVK